MTDIVESMEDSVTKILDDMLIQNLKYHRAGVHSYVKEKLEFGKGLGEVHLRHKNESKLIKPLNSMLDYSKYKIIMDTKELEESVKTRINLKLKD